MKFKQFMETLRKLFMQREYKDRLLIRCFRDKKDLLDLYNALNGSHYTNPNDLEITTLEDGIYMSMKNDLSFIIFWDMCLYEHQSTYNPNMPLRGMLYFARLYEAYVELHDLDIYGSKRLELPSPHFIVFYNGDRKMPDVSYLKLSEMYRVTEKPDNTNSTEALSNANRRDNFNHADSPINTNKTDSPINTANTDNPDNIRGTIPLFEEGHPVLECTATMLNINYGHNESLMKSCKRLNDYVCFVEYVRNAQKQGLDNTAAIRVAIDECIEQGILTDILIKQRAEVFHMLLTEFDEKKYKKRLKREVEEARQEAETARQEVEAIKQRADLAEQKAETEKLRAERLLSILISHNISLDEIEGNEIEEHESHPYTFL